MTDLALFDVDVPETAPAAGEELSADRRRTQRQAALLAAGRHPLSAVARYDIRLHANAAPADDRSAPGLRCGTCAHRVLARWHRRTYAKCAEGLKPDEPLDRGLRASHGAASDCRAWWPACRDYQEREA